MDVSIPRVISAHPLFVDFVVLVNLPDLRVPIPTNPDALAAVDQLARTLATSASSAEVKAAALSLRHEVLSSNPLAEDPDRVNGDANVDDAVDVPDQQQNIPAILRRLDRLERNLRTQIGNVHADLRERLEELEADLGERLQELQAAQRQRAMRERNAMRWELGRDLEPIPVEDRRFPEGLDNVGSQRVRHGRDLRRMSLHDIDLWLEFYGIEAGVRVRKSGKEKLLLRFLGGQEKRSL